MPKQLERKRRNGFYEDETHLALFHMHETPIEGINFHPNMFLSISMQQFNVVRVDKIMH
jgi:hypothetical protein